MLLVLKGLIMQKQMTNSFNLVRDPWIPVIDLEGKNKLVSLDSLFRDAANLTDLDALPHERISILRLLVCITQAKLGAPETPDDWEGFGDDLEKRIPEYLHREDIYPHFNLLGEGKRFLQVSKLLVGEPTPITKLIPYLASGNNPTFFDHDAMNNKRDLPCEKIAIGLLAFQNFYPLYGSGYKGKGPCVDRNMAHTIVFKENIKNMILFNCLTKDYITDYFKEGQGRPIWELREDSPDFYNLATMSYLGRLVPKHRSLKILDTRYGFIIKKESIEYAGFPQVREASSTVQVIAKKDQQEYKLLSLKLNKSVWRDLHTMSVLRQANLNGSGSPLMVQIQAQRNSSDIKIWVGGLVTDFKAKIIDSIESVFTIPYQMLTERGRARYQAGVEYAESRSNSLYGAVKQYAGFFKNEKTQDEEAKRYYWSALDQSYHLLFDIVKDTDPMTSNFGEGDDPWTKVVVNASRAAYDFVCARQTPRQLQAYAAGLKVLLNSSASQKPKKRGLKS